MRRISVGTALTCAFVALAAGAALADGGSSIANAPELPIGKRVRGGGTSNDSPPGPTGGGWSNCCYGEYWRIRLNRADHLRVAVGSLNGNGVEVGIYDPSVKESTWNQRRGIPLAYAGTARKDELRYVATKRARFTMYVVNDCGACGQPSLAYELTAYVRHYTRASLAGPRVARADSAITLRGKISGLSAGKVAIQSRSPKKGWKTLALMRVKRDGSFGYKTRVGAPGTYSVRAVFSGDASHLPSRAVISVKVVRASLDEVSSAAPKSCPKGSVSARIAGKRTCLKAGQTCKRTLDRQYHRYGFHCHTGGLTRSKPKPPEVFTRKVDVGGFRLAISCRGTGSPTVILESGENASAQAWFLLDRMVAKTTRVCSYDRAGLGFSDARVPPDPAPASKVVEELHSLLAGAGISPPYVLGGHSLGGFFNRLYTKRYPADVHGLVGVEGMPIGLAGEPWWGFLDLIGGPGGSDSYYLAAARAELAAAPDLGARPLVLLTHGIGPRGASPEDEALWLTLQKRIALLSTSSILVRADNAGYAIQTEALDLTAEAFRQVIAAVRARAPLPACSATPLPRLGGTCLDPNSP